MKVLQVPENVFQALVNYIAARPYQEVNQLLTATFQTAKLVEVADPAPPAAPKPPQAPPAEQPN